MSQSFLKFPPVWNIEGSSEYIKTISLPKNKILSFSYFDSIMRIWDVNGRCLKAFEGHSQGVSGVSKLSDGRIISYGEDRTVRIWDSDGNSLAELKGPSDDIRGVRPLEGGRILAWSADHNIYIWDGKESEPTVMHQNARWFSRLTSDYLLSRCHSLWDGSTDYTMRLWDKNGNAMAVFVGHTASVNSFIQLKNNHIVSISNDSTLRIWSLEGKCLAILAGHNGPVRGVIQLSDDQILSWGDDLTLRIWSLEGESMAILTGHKRPIRKAIQLANGNILSWGEEKNLRIWNSDGNCLRVLEGHQDQIYGVLELGDSRFLSWCYTYVEDRSRDRVPRIWDGKGNCIAVLEGHTQSVSNAAQLRNGNIITWGKDHTPRIWDPDGKCSATLYGHSGDIEQLYQIESGQIVSTSMDSTIRLWNESGSPMAVLGSPRNNGAKLQKYELSISHEPMADISMMILKGTLIQSTYCFSPDNAFTIQNDTVNRKTSHRKQNADADPSRTGKKLGKILQKNLNEKISIYISIRSFWGARVFSAFPSEIISSIQGIQCTLCEAFDFIAPILLEMKLGLLQLSALSDTDGKVSLYGIQAERMVVLSCPALNTVTGNNCVIPTVEILSSPRLESVHIDGPMGEANVVWETLEELASSYKELE